jgi:biotin carboxyl carrier protein
MILKRFGLVLLALIGIIFSIFMIQYGLRKPPVAPILFPPPVAPYRHYIAAEGIVESAFKNIPLGVCLPQVITDVYVFVGDLVEAGQPIFKTDTRQLEAQLAKALNELAYAEIDYTNKKVQFSFYERLDDKTATSEQMFAQYYYAMKLAHQNVETAKAAVDIITTDIERSIVRAPIDGEVLQVNIRIGQYANDNPYDQQPLVLFGDTCVYHLRIEIDEEDEWRFTRGAPAMAFVRGNSRISFPLEYVYTEPYIVPKKSLSGSDIERVDTRVLEVVYQFNREDLPVFMGQLLDIYIEAKPNEIVA